jgi:hypothetical protein
MLWLNSEERAILKAAKEKKESPDVVQKVIAAEIEADDSRPYRTIYYSNKNLTVILKDGTMLSKTGDSDFYNSVVKATTRDQIEALMIDKCIAKEPDEVQEKVDLVSNMGIFHNNSEFEVKGSSVYLKGVSLELPTVVATSFIEILEKQDGAEQMRYNITDLENQYTALKMFWLKLALNPLPQSREDLLTFIRKNSVKITPNGNLVLYRRIVSKADTNKAFIAFVTQEYYRLKKMGADTREYAVAKFGDKYESIHLASENIPQLVDKLIGNLQVMYMELPKHEGNSYTSAHDHSVSIKLGAIYSIPESKINLNNGICAAGGLHAAAVDYNYSGFGDIPVVVLVNPCKAITVPLHETGKLRTTEMFVACVNDKPQGTHFDDRALVAFDEEYHDLTITELELVAKTKSFEKLTVKEEVPAISLVDLSKIKDMLRTKVKVF